MYRGLLILAFFYFGLLGASCSPTPITIKYSDTAKFPGGTLTGNFYGAAVELNGDFFFVAAPGSQNPSDSSPIFAIYVYRHINGEWTNTQILQSDWIEDYFGRVSLKSEGDWLFATSREAISIFHLNQDKRWKLHQVLNAKNIPDFSELTLGNQNGTLFGSTISLDAKKGWAIAGAQGFVFFFKIDKNSNQWKLIQKVVNPEKVSTYDSFGTSVEINNGYAFISNGELQIDHKQNSSVWIYKLESNQWKFFQKLQGSQTQSKSDAQGYFDGFGNSMSIHKEWAVISAPLESNARGAAYVYKLSGKKWDFRSKVSSDERINPSAPGHMVGCLNGVKIHKKTLLIGDPGHFGSKGEFYQGAILAYELKDGDWILQHIIYPPNGIDHQFFGASFALDDKHLLSGTMTALDLAYPHFIPPSNRMTIEVAPGIYVPAIAEGEAVLYNIKCK